MSVEKHSKVYADAASALRDVVKDGMTLMCGGFGACGIPENLIDALHASGVGDLTVVSNNAGLDGVGLGLLLQTRQIRKMISSYEREQEFERQYLKAGGIAPSNPQWHFGGAYVPAGAGIPGGFYNCRRRHIGRRRQGNTRRRRRNLMCSRRTGNDVSLVKRGRAMSREITVARLRNFNPNMATAGRVTVAEVEHLVEPGDLDPDGIHTPGIFVQRIVQGARYTKLIEKRTVRKREEKSSAVVA